MPDINILNIPVSFPNQPYMSQMSMMTRIINSLNKKQNCLLELPTGSGKTMALLCSTLAWLNVEKKKNLLLEASSLEASPSVESLAPLREKELPNPNNSTENKPSLPKIYFGTRTHKQIGQVVRELKKSAYANIKMSILSGRRQTCVNKSIVESKDIDQSCKDICNTKEGCYYKVDTKKPNPDDPWDIESIKKTLKKDKLCPHYTIREWTQSAEIIFCPYNYILNPYIRQSVKISLKNAIVILDEAHNIEDICRDGASISISQEDLNICQFQIYKLLNHPLIYPETSYLINLLKTMDNMIEIFSKKLFFKNEDVLKKVWTVEDFVALMKQNELNQEQLNYYMKLFMDLLVQLKIIRDQNKRNGEVEYESETKSETRLPNLSSNCIQMLESFFMTVFLLLDKDNKYEKDFCIVITEGERYNHISEDKMRETQDMENEKPSNGNWLNSKKRVNSMTESPNWLNSRKRKETNLANNFVLNIWCMNPGIEFKSISNLTHSIILTSGTLSPMSSFQKELGCKFESSLEAPHVVKKNQTFIAGIGRGPTGSEIQAIYKNTEKVAFQDELGRMLLGFCEVVPNGVLCFLSSFVLMENLIRRWTETKLMDKIEKHKTVFSEPRNTNEMNICMEGYYGKIEMGALLFAVYRGKASEGMDFADTAARLVITVGIPYPSLTDPKIVLKRNYNQIKNKETMGQDNQYLSGGEWYNIQAFRALNQALGRCIRHRSDWGAMIMIDSRFGGDNSNYLGGLCKWIRQRQNYYENWNDMHYDLCQFVAQLNNTAKEIIL